MKTISCISTIACILILASCSMELPPAISESNKIDNWSLDVGNMNELSQTWVNSYLCTSDTSKLEIDGAISGGQLMVVVRDATNNELFNKTYTTISSYEQLLIAPAGMWNVEVKAVNLNGSFSIDLTAEKIILKNQI